MNDEELKAHITKMVTAEVTRKLGESQATIAGLRKQLETIARNDAVAGRSRTAPPDGELVEIRKGTRQATYAETLEAAKAAAANPSATQAERARLAEMVIKSQYATRSNVVVLSAGADRRFVM